MYLLVVFLSLISFFVASLFGRFLKVKQGIIIILSNSVITFLLTILLFYEVCLTGHICRIKLFSWVSSSLLVVNGGFYFDSLTTIMLVIVCFISCLVHFYSVGYMGNDPHITRFMSYLSLFTFFMIMLVTADNLLQMFLGGEGVGLASYLLINFWFKRLKANQAAIKAMLVNRLGDFGLALGLLYIYNTFKSLDYLVIFPLVYTIHDSLILFLNMFEIKLINLIAFLLFIGVMGKSAQLGLHVGLPDAMEGPTPVSALIHAATMVTAGVFVLIRCSPIFEYANNVLIFITIMGALTALFGSMVAMFQNDLKKIIAYSTCSQLGYMVCACGISNYSVALAHLANHAIFKALLFLTAGFIIHALGDEQDINKMGYLAVLQPFSYILLFVGSMSLAGLPYLTGFYSKHYIMELSTSTFAFNGLYMGFMLYIGAFFTCVYSFRLIYKVCFFSNNSYKSYFVHFDHISHNMSVVLIVLAIGSIFFGYFSSDLFLGFGGLLFSNSIYINQFNIINIELEFLPIHLKLLPIFLFLVAWFSVDLIHIYYNKSMQSDLKKIDKYFFHIYNFFQQAFMFNVIYNNFFVKFSFKISYVFAKYIDKGFLELVGSTGLVKTLLFITRKMSYLQRGFLYDHVILILWFLLIYCFFCFINVFFIIFFILFNIVVFFSLVYIYLFVFFYFGNKIKILIIK